MPYIPPEVVAKAKEMDLLTYLKNYEPGELVHFGEALIVLEPMTASKSPMANGAGFPVALAVGQLWTI